MSDTLSDRRRADDLLEDLHKTQLAAISGAVANLDVAHDKTRNLLEGHVSMCAKLQKYQLIGISVTFGWIVAHSPEASKLAIEVVKLIAP